MAYFEGMADSSVTETSEWPSEGVANGLGKTIAGDLRRQTSASRFSFTLFTQTVD